VVRTISEQERRRVLIRRHHLAGDARSPEAVTGALIALHATDPASVYLSVLARSATSTVAGIAQAMYDRRSLVRWMAMRRTLFVFPREDIPMIQAAISTPLAGTLRTRLINQLERNGTDPPIDGGVEAWLGDLESRVELALDQRGTATGAQLSTDVPELTTSILVRAPSDRPQNVTTSLLTLMSTEGRLVRSTPTGAWTSRHHRWEPIGRWWPNGIPAHDTGRARQELAHRWLTRFGPGTVEDLQWWTGWNQTITRRALDNLPIREIDLHGRPGITLREPAGDASELADDRPDGAEMPVAALLPALDPTPMGWKHRDWFLGIDHRAVFDRAGNIGPTLWWNGEIIGSWAITADGDLRTRVLVDRGADATAAIGAAADHLHQRLEGATITPAIRTPLEQSITQEVIRPRGFAPGQVQ
jgi:Winged helix DNA-binding domain